MQITVSFTRTNTWLSKVIRWFTKGQTSHVYFHYYDMTFGMDIAVSSEWNGLVMVPLKKYEASPKSLEVVDEFAVEHPALRDSVIWFLNQWAGTFYDYKSFFWTGLARFFRQLLHKKISTPKALICSEGVIRLLRHAGYNHFKHLNPDITGPGPIREAMLENPEVYKRLPGNPRMPNKPTK